MARNARAGACVAGLQRVDLPSRIDQLKSEFEKVSKENPGLVRTVVIAAAVVAVLSLAVPVWYLASLQRGLPDKAAIARIGEMDQATTIYDAHDQLVFTIFKQ